MKKISLVVVIALIAIFTACDFRKSVSTDLMTGLSTKGDGLSAKEVYVSNGEVKVKDNTFVYGQEIFTNFLNMDGFVVENNQFYPEMEVVVLSKAGDTIMSNRNLLGGKGLDANLKTLNGNLILATPIQSGTEYTVKYIVSDTKSDGVFSSELDFKLDKDPMVKINQKGLRIKEAYIFNQDTRKVITSGEIGLEENLLFDLQGLEGYSLNSARPNLGISVHVTDANDQTILKKEDLLGDRVLTEAEIKQGMGSTLKIRRGNLANPIKWEVRIWDKNSDTEVFAFASLNVK